MKAKKIQITTIEEYLFCIKRGYHPLYDLMFDLSFSLRIEIQDSLFFGSIPQRNEKYYRWNWANKTHHCEECLTPLHNYSAVYVSHIISRKAGPETAFDPRNNNILCPNHHAKWEDVFKRTEMRIFEKNETIIKLLKDEYQGR